MVQFPVLAKVAKTGPNRTSATLLPTFQLSKFQFGHPCISLQLVILLLQVPDFFIDLAGLIGNHSVRDFFVP